MTLNFALEFDDEEGTSSRLSLTLPYAPSALAARTVKINRRVGKYDLRSLKITPVGARLSYRLEPGENAVSDMLLITNEAREIWFQTGGRKAACGNATLKTSILKAGRLNCTSSGNRSG